MNESSPGHSIGKSVCIVSSGNFLEMFDFMVFGYYARAIGSSFFPQQDEYASLLLAFMTFGAGFLMRPLGALLLGAYVDRHGRRRGLILTLALMGAGTLTIAMTPGYAQLGLLAPCVVLAGRLLQGLSAGVEVGGVSVYLSEIAPAHRRGFFVAWQSASQQAAVVFAALTGLVLNAVLPAEAVMAWGWRIPFFIGSLLLPFLFAIRSLLRETPQFQARTVHPTAREIFAIVAGNVPLVLLCSFGTVMTTVFFYTITAYTPTYGSSVLHLSAASAMLVTACVGCTNFVLLPVMGALSDRVGRLPLLLTFAVLGLATGYAALAWLTLDPSFSRLLAVELWFAVIFAGYNGALIAHLTEVMPRDVRTTGFSLSYSLATGIFGGFTPAIATYLIKLTGNPAAPGLWLTAAAAISLCSILALARTARRPLPVPGSTHAY